MILQISKRKSEDYVPPIVLLVDDDAFVREAISDLLKTVGIMAKQFSLAQDLLKQLEDFNYGEIKNANCLILDVRMSGMEGFELQHRLRTAHLNVPIIFISAHGNIRMTLDAMKAGALDCLSKPFHSQDMLDSVEAAVEYDHRRREIDSRQEDLLVRYSSLTPRERSILALAARDLMNKQIAWELSLSEIRVKVNRSHLMQKVKAQTIAELVRMEARLNRMTSNKEDAQISREVRRFVNNRSLSN